MRTFRLLAICLALGMALPLTAAIPVSEREALIALFDATNGSEWIDNTNWNGAAGTECTWAGVQCNEQQTSVIGIFLWQNNLTGSLPSEIGNFPNLTDLELWENTLTGPLPSGVGNLTNLKRLVIDNNRFNGPIPAAIGNLGNLEFFAALGNEFSGPIPPEIGNLPRIDSIRLGVNALTSIPPEIGNLGTLTNLELYQNAFSGPIPPELGNLSSLITLNLSINEFSGAIPPELGNLKNLEFLSLDANLLSGPIPDELGNATALGWLFLSRNQLTGPIPETFQQLAGLHHLELFSNQLTGPIPPSLGNLSNLEVLRIGDNELSGTLPTSLGNLRNLVVLTVGNNELTGPLPRELGNLTHLVALSFESNAISGSLPAELTNLTELEELVGFENALTGTLPADIGRWSRLRVILLGSNRLRGTIPGAVTALTELTSLGLQGNQLTGVIPSDIGRLTKLENLWLFANRLGGPIPPSIGDLELLRSLRLDQNELTGTIPVSLSNLDQLEELLLNDNRLEGVIPTELTTLDNLYSLAIGSNLLTGAVPSSLGNLTNLIYLDFSNNDLRGEIPATLVSLQNLIDNLSDFRYNALRTSNEELRQFLNQKQDGGDWESTQTVQPTNVRVVSLTDRSAIVSWDTIPYDFDEGGYRVSALAAGSVAPVVATTAYKVDDSILVRGLSPSTSYQFTVRTVTHPHGLQKNTIVSDPSSPASGATAAAVILPPQIEVARFPEGLVQRGGVAQNQDGFVLVNRGDLSSTIDLSRVGDFFTQAPESFQLGGGASRTVTLTSLERPEGLYEGESVPMGEGVPSGLTIPVKLLSTGAPEGAARAESDQTRISTAGEKGTTTEGQLTFHNTGDATLNGFLVSDVAWIIPPEELVTIAAGESRTLTFTIDRTKRPDAEQNGEGALSGTIRLLYLDGSSSAGVRHVGSQTTGVSSTLVTIVDTSKPSVTPSGIPTLAPGEIALFYPGVTRSTAGGFDLTSDLSIVNSFFPSPLQDLRLYFSAPSLAQARVAAVQSLAPTQSLSYGSLVDGVYELEEIVGTAQLRSQRAQSVLTDAVLLHQVEGSVRVMTMPVFRSDRGLPAGAELTIPGTRHDEQTTTEIYLQELSGQGATAEVSFLSANGTLLGPSFMVELEPFGFSATSDLPQGAMTTVVRNRAGSSGGLGAWARTIDGTSGDVWALTNWARTRGFDDALPMRFPLVATEESASSGRRRPVRRPDGSGKEGEPGLRASASSRTELLLTNGGESRASAVIRLFTGSGASSETTVSLEPGATTTFADIAAALGRPGATGQIVIEPLDGRFAVFARYIDGDAGGSGSIPVVADASGLRLGQFLTIPFVEDATRAHSQERLAGSRRTDVGLMENAGAGATVRMSLRVFDGSRLTSANVFRDFVLAPRETLYVRSIAAAIIGSERDALFGDLKNLQLEIQVVGGEGAVTPFLVTVENGSGDLRFRME